MLRLLEEIFASWVGEAATIDALRRQSRVHFRRRVGRWMFTFSNPSKYNYQETKIHPNTTISRNKKLANEEKTHKYENEKSIFRR